MRFYEQMCDDRTVISEQIEPDAQRVMRDIGADCWIDAKKKLGYGLSTLQEWLLDEFYRERERRAASPA
jgi:hypothetical protein